MLTVIILTIVIFALGMVGLSIGMIVRGRALRGSCHGPQPVGPDGRPVSCGHCDCRQEETTPSEPVTVKKH